MSASQILSRLSIPTLLFTLVACSGGDAGTSTGTGIDPNDPSLTENNSNGSNVDNNLSGSFEGSMVFSNGDSDPITISFNGEGLVSIEANPTTQSTTGTLNDGRFTSSGTVNFDFNGQNCAGPTVYVGELISNELIEGTFTSEPICETAAGGTEVLNLDGSFSASLDSLN